VHSEKLSRNNRGPVLRELIRLSQRPVPQNGTLGLEIHPVLERLLLSRGASSPDDVQLELSSLLPPQTMLNMEQAVELLLQALEVQQKILIIGDFDADGATSTALLMLGLRAFGFEHLDYLVPNRFEFGYGLTPEIVEVAKQRQPALIITVDNGIASFEGVEKARSSGIRVLITDHHLPADSLPLADAILNPNQAACPFPSKALAGVGVAYYLLLALRSHLRERRWFADRGREEPNMLQFLDLVALGTVADVVPLDRNNRCLVKHGLELIRSGRGRPGIRALISIAGRDYQKVQAADLGFVLGPRLNAAGRLDDMSLGIECLLAASENEALNYARLLNDLNQDRKSIEQNMQEQALAVLDALDFDASEQPGICLYDPDWHAGVVGILASRLKDRFHKPTLIFARSTENPDEIKGSARSISGLHIRDLLDRIATRHPGLLSRFGGHAMAAGLTLPLESFADFKLAFEEELKSIVDEAMLQQQILTDGELDSECLSMGFAELLERAGPWGQQFPEPLFTGNFSVLQRRVLGDKHLKFVLRCEDSDEALDAIAFNVGPELLAAEFQEFEIAYRLQVNEFRGRRSVQLMIEHFLS
jgi:single-stranded-DNA-specific exonuclease